MFIGIGLGLVAQAIYGGVGDNALNDYGTPHFLADFIESEYRNNGPLSSSFTALTGLTFTRASTGYAQTQGGVLVPFASGAPRITDKGLLIEGARTNLCLQSQTFDNASWMKSRSSISANAATAPDSTLTADKLVEDSTATSTHRAYQAVSKAASPVTYTGSVYLKAAERTFARLKLGDNTETDNASVGVNLVTGELGVATGTFTSISATSSLLADGWVRVTLSATSDSDTQIVLFVFTSTGLTVADATYSGNGTSGLYLWGAQLEAAAFPSSYIPTTTTSVTRAADVATIDLLNPGLYGVSGQAELKSTGAIATTGTPGGSSTYDTGTGVASLERTDAANVAVVKLTGTGGKVFVVQINNTGANPVSVRSGGTSLSVINAGQSATVVARIASGQDLQIWPNTNAATHALTIVSIKEIPAEQIIDYPCTIWAEFEPSVISGAEQGIICVEKSGGLTDVAYIYQATSGAGTGLIYAASAAQMSAAGAAFSAGNAYKVAMRIAANDGRYCQGGTLATLDSSVVLPNAPDRILLGQRYNLGGFQAFGYIRRAAIWSGAFTDAQLQAVST